MIVALKCEGENVSINDFKYLYGFSDDQFDKLIRLRFDKGYFNYKSFEFIICSNRKSRKKRSYNFKVKNKVTYEANGTANTKQYFIDGKHVTIADIAKKTGYSPRVINRLMISVRSIEIKGVKINAIVTTIKCFELTNVKDNTVTEIKTITALTSFLRSQPGSIYKAIADNRSLRGYKIKRVKVEI